MFSRTWKSDCSSVLVVLAAGWMPSAAWAGDIKIIEGIPPGFELVRLTDDPTMEHSVPSINDAGEVVFGKFVSADALGNLYRFSGGLIRQLTDASTYDLNIVTNNFSQIAWDTCVNSDGPFDVVSDYVDGPISGDAHPASFIDMNDASDIVWKHRPQVGVSEFDIYYTGTFVNDNEDPGDEGGIFDSDGTTAYTPIQLTATIYGDFDGDSATPIGGDQDDIAVFNASFPCSSPTSCTGEDAYNPLVDFDCDAAVGCSDRAAFLANFPGSNNVDDDGCP